MTTIKSTVESALTEAGYGSYLTYAAPVIAALEERETSIVETLEAAASQAGFSYEETQTVLQQAGLTEPEPAAPAYSDSQDLASVVRDLADTVGRLVRAAESRGIRV